MKISGKPRSSSRPHKVEPHSTRPRLIFVTGKGGTGKSTCAAALALAASRRWPTLMCDLDMRLSAARALGADLNGSASAQVNHLLEVRALTPQAELRAFVERIVPLKAVSRRMLQSRTFGYVTAALPGLESFLMLDRLRIIAGDMALRDGYAIIDAPASGSALELLNVARGLGELAPAGTLNRLASAVQEFLADPNRFGVVLTLIPEELALREALESARFLKEKLGIPSVTAILNEAVARIFSPAELKAAHSLLGHARMAERREHAAEFGIHACEALEREGVNVIELPMLFTPALGPDEVAILAHDLAGGYFAA